LTLWPGRKGQILFEVRDKADFPQGKGAFILRGWFIVPSIPALPGAGAVRYSSINNRHFYLEPCPLKGGENKTLEGRNQFVITDDRFVACKGEDGGK